MLDSFRFEYFVSTINYTTNVIKIGNRKRKKKKKKYKSHDNFPPKRKEDTLSLVTNVACFRNCALSDESFLNALRIQAGDLSRFVSVRNAFRDHELAIVP